MSRKLIVLDALLVIVMLIVGAQFRKHWQAAKARDIAASHPRVAVPPVPPLPKIEPAPPVSPSKYVDVAQKDLFDKSRNPNIPVEPPKPAPPPPPPPPPPPLPVFYGFMVLRSGPIAILAANAGGQHQAVHVGEPIGQYRLTDIASDSLTLEWNGQTFVKSTDELGAHAKEQMAQASQSAAPSDGGRTQAPAPPPEPVKPGPGAETPYGIRACNMNDGTPEGAVMDGYRKVIYTSPFGKTCGWERVK